MTVINHKSISGITSITTPAGSDNLFTVHTNNQTERFRIDSSGRLLIGRTSVSNSDSKIEIQDATNTYVRITSGNTTGSTGVIFGTSDDHSTGGIYYDGSNDTLSLAGHNNTTRLSIDSSGDVGIGTVNPSRRLHVTDYGDHGVIRIEGSGNTKRSGIEFYRETSAGVGKGGASIWIESDTSNSSGKLRFGTASNAGIQSQNTDMILDNNGRLGIGTVTPDSILALEGTGSDNATRITIKDGTGIAEVNGRYGNLILDSDRDNAVNGSVMTFQIDNDEKLRITSSGYIGINEASPASYLHIDGESNDPYIYLQRSGAGDAALDIGGIFWKNDTKLSALIKCRTIDRDDAELIFETMYQNSRTEKLRIKNDGKLMTQSAGQIYTASSAGSLTLAGGNTNLGGKIVLTGGNGTGNIAFHAQQSTATPAVRMTILGSNGKVGIWETNPTRALSVGGSVNIQSGERIESYSSGGNLIIQGGSTYPGGHIKMWGGSGDDMITFNTSGAGVSSIERLRITSAGNLILGDHTAPLSTYNSSQPRLSIYRSSGSGGYLELGGNIPHNGHSSGTILFINKDNSNAASNDANGRILAMQRVENVTSDTNAGDDCGGDLVFMTKPEAGTLAERMRITGDGRVRIDGATSANHGLRFTPGGWNGYDNRMGYCGASGSDFWWSSNWNPTDGSRDHSGYATNFIKQSATGNGITFGTGDTNTSASERMRITKDGNVGIGEDDPQTKLNVKGCVSTGRNLAREVGTIINISSSYSGSRNGTSVISGQKNYEENTNGDWITANGQRANANLTIDLGAQYTCDRFVIYNQNEYANNVREVKRFTLEGSNDNSSWTTILDDEAGASYGHEPNPGWSFHMPANNFDDVEGVTYRYWKFTMKTYHGSTTLGGVMELELYEASDTTTSEITTHSVVATDIYAKTIHHEAPAFFACRNSSFSISNQTTTLVQFVDNQGPGFDTNGCWDNNNYRFVPNVPGYYSINMVCSVSYGSLQAGRIYIFKNGSAYAMSQLYLNGGEAYDDISMACSTLVFLNGTGDYIDGRAWRNGGNGGLGDNETNQQISGFLARSAGPRVHGAGYA